MDAVKICDRLPQFEDGGKHDSGVSQEQQLKGRRHKVGKFAIKQLIDGQFGFLTK